jgi:hypothetical protein
MVSGADSNDFVVRLRPPTQHKNTRGASQQQQERTDWFIVYLAVNSGEGLPRPDLIFGWKLSGYGMGMRALATVMPRAGYRASSARLVRARAGSLS